MQEWVDKWDRDHPDLASRSQRGEAKGRGRQNGRRSGAVGAMTILHERTALTDPLGRGVPKETIRALLAKGRRSPYTELRTADLLVAAIERPEVFHDGTLAVEPNPSASVEARASCCGGSLNGAVAPAT